MTQKQQIDLLNSIMPEIVSTKDPEKVMLKCAKSHNLAPAQLEKLAQVFNTTKTLVGLEKQANRGDSFSIVDVPNLVSSYVTYEPEAALNAASRSIHTKVNKLVKGASSNDPDGWNACLLEQDMSKSASAHMTRKRLPEFMERLYASNDIIVEDQSDTTEYVPKDADYDVLHKSAAFLRDKGELAIYNSVEADITTARDHIAQVKYEIGAELLEKCAEARSKFSPDEGNWAESVEDLVDAYGENAVPVISMIEDHFERTHLVYTPADLTKRASAPALVRDRHDMFELAEYIMELTELHKQAALVGDVINQSTEKPDYGPERNIYTKDRRDAAEERMRKAMDAYHEFEEDTRNNSGAPNPEGKARAGAWRQQNTDNTHSRPAGSAGDSDRSDRPVIAPRPGGSATPRAGGDEAPTPNHIPENIPSGGRGEAQDTVAEAAPKVVVTNMDELLRGMQDPYFRMRGDIDAPLDKLDSIIHRLVPKTNKKQKDLDEAESIMQMESTIQRLMLSDPTIRDADQGTVRDIFKTISEISPTYAKDPMKMAPVLKEALQYDAVPVHILKEIATQEGQFLKNDALRRSLESNKYDSNPNGKTSFNIA